MTGQAREEEEEEEVVLVIHAKYMARVCRESSKIDNAGM